MKEKIYKTQYGEIHYWLSDEFYKDRKTLVMLPGLTADHRLFNKQIAFFEGRYNLFTWDAPGHNVSRPFQLNFTLMDKATWLDEILTAEGIEKPVLVGQSMGGYVGQAYMQKYSGNLAGFVSIDSAPLQREYMRNLEIEMLKKIEPVYRWYPWRLLVWSGSIGTASTKYGQQMMKEMMLSYSGSEEYSKLVGHGYRMLAQSIESDLPYIIDCPAMLICGEKDMVGSTKNYNIRWSKKTGLPIEWIPDAGHNSNTDQPEIVDSLIENFLRYRLGY